MDDTQLIAISVLAGIVIGMSILTFCWWREKPQTAAPYHWWWWPVCRLRGHNWPQRNGCFEISVSRLMYCRRCGCEVCGRTIADLRPPTAEELMDDYFDDVAPEHCECQLDHTEDEEAANECFCCGGKIR